MACIGIKLVFIFVMFAQLEVAFCTLSESDKGVIVPEHNRVRSEVSPSATNMEAMYWNDELAAGAQAWADNCVFEHNTGSDRDKGWGVSIGQNLYGRWSSSPGTWEQAIQSWESEKSVWTYGDDVSSDNGHYTQMINAKTALVGCGYAACPDNFHYYVCDYATGQMSNGQYTSGTVCSECEDNCSTNTCDCGGILCHNGGTLDLESCTCNCPSSATGQLCETYICPSNDPDYCDDTLSFCTQYSNWWEFCPILCEKC